LRNHARLARAGTGQHQTRAVHVIDCIALGLIETVGHEESGEHPEKLAGAIVTRTAWPGLANPIKDAKLIMPEAVYPCAFPACLACKAHGACLLALPS
jgi:hypothetical protein